MTRAPFETTRNERTVVFGHPWATALPRALEALGATRVAIVCSARRTELADAIAAAIGDRYAGAIPLARQHVPRPVVDEATAAARDLDADALVAIGGGSAIGLAKAMQLDARRAFVAIPTTYSGSEMTEFYGIREGTTKHVGRDAAVRPDTVIYDPALTTALPVRTSVVSAFNALAHAVDALYGTGRTPGVDELAAGAIADITSSLVAVHAAPGDLAARTDLLHGAHLAATILGSAGMALHHKLAHVIAGGFDLPHADTHTILLPHVVAFNAAAAKSATAVVARAIGSGDPAAALYDLAARVGAPTALADLGMTDDDARDAARQVAGATFDNVRATSQADAYRLISAALRGARPSVHGAAE